MMTSVRAFQCASLNAFVGCALAFMDTLSSALVLLLGDALAMSFFCITLIIYIVLQLVHDGQCFILQFVKLLCMESLRHPYKVHGEVYLEEDMR